MHFSHIASNSKILLYGYGLEGQSSERWLKTHRPTARLEVYEDGQAPVDLDSYDLIIKSPGVPPRQIPDKYWSKVTSNLRLFLESLPEADRAKVIGITGSKGKSTTTKFTYELLQTAGFKSTIIGNFGVPALDIWDEVAALDYIIAEGSSFQLYDLKVSPKYALFLSFFPDHLDWHGVSEVDYFAAKENLWVHQQAGDFLFVPDTLPANVGIALAQGKAAVRIDPIKFTQAVNAALFPADSNLQAQHFCENLGTVWALAETLGIKNLPSVWHQTAQGFEAIEHRLERVRTHGGLTFINDSIATSPDATLAGVAWQGENLSGLILDGADTGMGGFEDLIETLKTASPKALIALVESDVAAKFKTTSGSEALNTKTFSSYEAALSWLKTKAKQGTILFSPAGKSFNRFNNYSERGRYFKKLVENL